MKTIIGCTLKSSSSTYMLNSHKRGISLINPSLIPFIFKSAKQFLLKEPSESIYYEKKYNYLKTNGYFHNIENNYDNRLSKEIIENLISNIHHIVFEVTDACNLKCKYCGFGEFYDDYDTRLKKMINPKIAKRMIRYMQKVWESNKNISINRNTTISFYGGEPLLNVPAIEEIINYIESFSIKNHLFQYNMTTNAMLLDKYMNFLVKHSFNLLISLDGDKFNNSYRVTNAGKKSFPQIIQNIELLQKTYPKYFKEHVNFNAVLHNRNSVKSIFDFIHNKFGKTPNISELNLTGIKRDKEEEFKKLYNNTEESLYKEENSQEIEKELFMRSSAYHSTATFLNQYNHEAIKSYSDFFYKPGNISYLPTGTCLPFTRKIFITVNGKILPCERIGQQYALGEITESSINLDPQQIADKYNKYFDKFKQCNNCYHAGMCVQCMFNLDELNDEAFHCKAFMSKQDFVELFGKNMHFLETHREDYKKLMQVYLE